ncbi:hypothetical protein IHE45_17G037200 [Dioscorea alata]|uniref:Uncharacterized protein n=1 Tax=Dioscorea alata TaxID=55571 RepID=A0ACB7UBN2_DIOAL|nr:hypothetical protein IHE45_17G037200 [Dioscorea alata]
MLKSRGKSTARKPLANISNAGKRSRPGKKKVPSADGDDDGGAIDRLLLARSALSDLVAQVDELVAQALGNKTINKTGSQVVESFRSDLCTIHSSLKAWVPRLQQAFAETSTETERKSRQTANVCSASSEYGERTALPPDENKDMLEVSPSPLVSWRPGTCTVDCGRQLFLLTPLPKSTLLTSKQPGLLRSTLTRTTIADRHVSHGILALTNGANNADDRRVVDGVATSFEFSKPCTKAGNSTTDTVFMSPLIVSDQKITAISVSKLTPCLKKTSPKTCPLLHPASEEDDMSKNGDPHTYDPPSDEVMDNLASKYQALLGLQTTYSHAGRRKEVDESLDWFLSPPKTCILMEPSDEKLIPTPANVIALATPMWNGFESTFKKTKKVGENTLKRELWTKFEAATSSELHFNASVLQNPTKKGFLDMLEEVS